MSYLQTADSPDGYARRVVARPNRAGVLCGSRSVLALLDPAIRSSRDGASFASAGSTLDATRRGRGSPCDPRRTSIGRSRCNAAEHWPRGTRLPLWDSAQSCRHVPSTASPSPASQRDAHRDNPLPAMRWANSNALTELRRESGSGPRPVSITRGRARRRS